MWVCSGHLDHLDLSIAENDDSPIFTIQSGFFMVFLMFSQHFQVPTPLTPWYAIVHILASNWAVGRIRRAEPSCTSARRYFVGAAWCNTWPRGIFVAGFLPHPDSAGDRTLGNRRKQWSFKTAGKFNLQVGDCPLPCLIEGRLNPSLLDEFTWISNESQEKWDIKQTWHEPQSSYTGWMGRASQSDGYMNGSS